MLFRSINWIITGQKFLDEQCYERLHLATRLQKGLQVSLNRGGKFVACPCAGIPVSGPLRLEMETHSFADWLKEHEEFITTFTTGTCRLRWQEVSRTRPQRRKYFNVPHCYVSATPRTLQLLMRAHDRDLMGWPHSVNIETNG